MLLTLKLLLGPALVVASTLAGRRWGSRLAGILVVLPIVAGPILLIVFLEHGRAFAAEAATAATLGVAPLAVYVVVFAFVTRTRGWVVSLLASWLSVIIADLGLAQLDLPPLAALGLAVVALAGARLAVRRLGPGGQTSRVPPWWDLPARAVATAALIVLLTGLAAALGPVWTGVLTPFPIALSVVCAFTAAHDGHPGLVALLQGVIPGLNGFALFCFTVAVAVNPWGGAAAFGLAAAIAAVFAVALAYSNRVTGRRRQWP